MPSPMNDFASLALSKAGRNVANPEASDAFVASLVQERLSRLDEGRARAIERWLETTARKAWIKSAPARKVGEDEARALSAEGKTWALPAFATGSLVNIELGEEQRQEAMEIIDYLMSAQGPRLARLSFAEAVAQSKQWHEKMARSEAAQEDPEGTEIYLELSDGARWVVVKSAQSLSREGSLMRHCVGSYADKVAKGKCQIVSLRDKENRPSLTIEVVGIGGDGKDAPFEKAISVEWAQIRAKANAAPSLEHGEALRALFKKMHASGPPVVKTGALLSSGLVLHKSTQKLMALSELEEGYVIDQDASFRRRLPQGLERLSFAKRLSISEARLPEMWSLDARQVQLLECSGATVSIENRHPQGVIKVQGVEKFKKVALAAHQVDIQGQSRKSLWRDMLGASLTKTSVAMAALGLGPRPDLVSIRASEGEAVGVLASRLEIGPRVDGELAYVAHSCSFDSCSFATGASWVGCVEKGAPRLNHFAEGEDKGLLPKDIAKNVEVAMSENPVALLCKILRARSGQRSGADIQPQLEALATAVGSAGTTWIGSHDEDKLFLSHGNLVGISAGFFKRQAREELDRLRTLALARAPSEDWAKALAGEFDPGAAPAWSEGESFHGRSFSLKSWAAWFESKHPAMAAKAKECKLAREDFEKDPVALEALEALARSRARLDVEGARALWKKAGGQEGKWDFKEDFEDPDLTAYGPWRRTASLCWVAAPLDNVTEEANLSLVRGEGMSSAVKILSKALVGTEIPPVDASALDSDEVASRRVGELATMALCWPLGDVELATPARVPQEIANAAKGSTENVSFPLACAALGILLAKASGEPQNAPALAGEWARHLGALLRLETQSMISQAQSFAESHAPFEDRNLGLMQYCARARGEDFAFAERLPYIQDFMREQQAEPFGQADLGAMAQALSEVGAHALSQAARKAAESRKPHVATSVFASLDREGLLARLEMGCSSLSDFHRSQAIEAAKAFIVADWGEGVFGEISPDGLFKADAFWMHRGCLAGCAPMMRDALESMRLNGLKSLPAGYALGLMDPEELARFETPAGQQAPEGQKSWSQESLASLRRAITKARLARPGLPPGSSLWFQNLPAPYPETVQALIDGSQKGQTTQEALTEAFKKRANGWRVRWTTEQKRKIAQEVSAQKIFTHEMRADLLHALSHLDTFATFEPRPRR